MKKLFRRLTAGVCALVLCLTAASALSVEQALVLLEDNYIDPLPDAAYEAATLDELFSAVGDPYTYYMSPEENEAFFAQMESEDSVTGIGVSIDYTAEGILVTAVLDGGGAKDAGIRPGDLIIAVDGVRCVPAGEAHRALILGREGTWVTLAVRHADGTEQEYRVERRVVPIHNTNVTVTGDAGWINCDSFGSQTAAYFSAGVAENDELVTRWIVDLRGNLGGLADAAVDTLGIFTGEGPKLVYRVSDGGSLISLYWSDAETDKPVVVLVDGMSASSSEIFSGGVRSKRAGIVIGSRTYGKGTAQIVLDEDTHPELFDGDALKVTVYRFYTFDGNTTDRIGVLPTLLVDDGCARDVAALLSPDPPEAGEALGLQLNGIVYYVDLDAARAQYATALGELFSALAPDVPVFCTIDGVVLCLDPATAAAHYGITYAPRGFSDTAASPFAAQIDTLAAYGMLTGDGTGRFLPAQTLTRAELATMLSNVLNVMATRSTGFIDMDEESWYAASVNAMAFMGFMEGVGDGRFDPEGTLTQEQLITVLGRLARFLNYRVDDYALRLTEDELAAFDGFQSWAREGASILTGYDGSMLYTALSAIDPAGAVTREQAAATLCNLLKRLDILTY